MNNRVVLSILLVIAIAASILIYVYYAKPEQESSEGGVRIVIRDDANRTVVLDHRPRRIVTTMRIVTDVVLLFPQLRDSLIAIDDAFKDTEFAKIVFPKSQKLPTVGYKKYVDYEKIIMLNPDVVIAKKQQRSLKGMEELEDAGIAVIYLNLETPNDFIRAFRILGNLSGDYERAKALENYFENYIGILENRLSGAEKPTALLLFYKSKSRVFAVPGKEYIQNYELMLAGAKSLSYTDEFPGAGFYTVDVDKILAMNPEYIFVVSMKGDAYRYIMQNITGNPAMVNVTAVANGHVYPVPNDDQTWDMPTPRWILCALWMAKLMHGDLLSDLNMTRITIDFYVFMYNVSRDTATYLFTYKVLGVKVSRGDNGVVVEALRSPIIVTRAMLPNGSVVELNREISYLGSENIGDYSYIWVKAYWWPEEVVVRTAS